MIIHHVAQGSLEWHMLRIGKPTASEFDKIVGNDGKLRRNRSDKSQVSDGAKKYAIRLITEEILNRPLETLTGIEWMERGKELEPQAAKVYELGENIDTTLIGFVTTDDALIGASPDRLVGENGLLEIKVPAAHTHNYYRAFGFDEGYKAQVQGQLFVAERDWGDWMSYSQEFPQLIIRANRDEAFIRNLDDSLDEFLDHKAKWMEIIRADGFFEERARLLTAVDDQRAASELPQEAIEDVFGLPPLKGF